MKNVIRATVAAGLISSAALGFAGTAAAAPVCPAISAAPNCAVASQTVPASTVMKKDEEDGGGFDGGSDAGSYDAGGYDGGYDGGFDTGSDDGGSVAYDTGDDGGAFDDAAAEVEQPATADAPEQEAPVQDAPVQEAPVQEAPDQEAPDQEAPVQEAPVQEAPVQDVPAQEAPEQQAPEVDPTDAGPSHTPPSASPADASPSADPAAPEDASPAAAPGADVATAPQSDEDLARSSDPVPVDPQPAAADELEDMTNLVLDASSEGTTSWNHEVTTWNSSWISYDSYYRPILTNPYRSPLRLAYTYDGAPRIVTIPPLQQIVLQTPTPGNYGFTAVVTTPSGAVSNVSVGSFTGGGRVPAPGQAPAPKLPTPPSYRDVLVRLRYATGTSQPFRVTSVTDLGDDTAIGARHVLIDGAVEAWGQWTTVSGEREFDITETVQLPGLTQPAQVPLPGYSDVALAAATSPTDSGTSVPIWVAGAAGALGLGGAALALGLRHRN